MNALTTGKVAKFCGVNFRTVIRWIERGELKAFKLPGSRGDNRIEVTDLLEFMKRNNMPIPEELEQGKKKVLIVDDEQRMAHAIQRVLRRAGYDTAIANDGFQMGVMLSTFKPELVTLDLKMPNLDGLEALKYMRSNEQFEKVKVLVVSGCTPEEREAAVSIGAQASLAKPFENSELLGLVQSSLPLH